MYQLQPTYPEERASPKILCGLRYGQATPPEGGVDKEKTSARMRWFLTE